jgi:hypothetical protein
MVFENAVRPIHRPFMPILGDFLHIIFSVTNFVANPALPPSVTVSIWNDEIPVAMSPGVGLIFGSVPE